MKTESVIDTLWEYRKCTRRFFPPFNFCWKGIQPILTICGDKHFFLNPFDYSASDVSCKFYDP